MSPLDYITAGEAALAAAALAIRGNMLKPEARGWATSRMTSFVIMVLSIVFGMVAMDIWRRGDASLREAVAYSAVAMSSVWMLINLARQHKGPETL